MTRIYLVSSAVSKMNYTNKEYSIEYGHNATLFSKSMDDYFSMEHPWKIFLLITSTFFILLWTILIYGITYYINFGINELKRNILDYITISTYFYTLALAWSCPFFDTTMYLFGPFPDSVCYTYVALKNFWLLGCEFCLVVVCYLK